MKCKSATLLATAVAASMSGAATADFLGLDYELHDTFSHEGTDYNVWRMYAVFSGEGIIGFWGGAAENGPFTISNEDGVSFYQAPFASNALPQVGGALYNAFAEEFDRSSFLTIGAVPGYEPEDVGEVFLLTPGYSPSLAAPSFGGIGGVVANPGSPNSMSVDGRVLLMQLTRPASNSPYDKYDPIYGQNITISGQADGVNFQTVTSFFIPAPGALALLGVAGLVGTRRRRA